MEFPGLDEARGEALDLLLELAKDKLREYASIAVRIRDGQPEPILTLSLSLGVEQRA